MISNKKKARIAGLLYLVVVLTGIFSLAYVPSKVIFWDDPAATFNAIKESEMLFRLGIVSGLICYVFFLMLPIALYELLKPVNELYARLMVLLAVVSVPISFLNIQNKLTVLNLVTENQNVTEQLQSQVMFYLQQYDNGILLVSVFWGLWLFPFGYLVFKSGFLPKFFGVLLMLGCFGYLINFLGNSLISNYSDFGIAKYIRIPSALGEMGICLWLLIMGAKEKSDLK